MSESNEAPPVLTPEENDAAIEAIIRFQEENPDVWGDQDENGVDLARLRENLKLTPAERLRRNGRAVIFMRQVEAAGEQYRSTHRSGQNLS